MENKISACLVVYNEEKLIERCLKSISGVADEIIVVHDGECKDKTLEIAKKYGARIYKIKHTGNVDLNKIYAIERAEYDWVLVLDADEYLSNRARKEIPNLIKNPNIDAYAFKWPPYDGKKYIKGILYDQYNKTVLLRKSKLYQIGITDEPLRTHGKLSIRPDILLEHKPLYNNYTFERLKNKWFMWADDTARQINNLKSVKTYNVKDVKNSEVYTIYKKAYDNPGIYLTRYILGDFVKKLLRFKILFSSFQTWKILFMIYAKKFHTYKRIVYYKKQKVQK